MIESYNIDLAHARYDMGMTTTEAAGLLHVTRRTWELWESKRVKMPTSKMELFLEKVKAKKSPDRDLVVIHGSNGWIDVVSSDNFCSCRVIDGQEKEYEVSSLAVERNSKRAYVHRVIFREENNKGVYGRLAKWKSEIDM